MKNTQSQLTPLESAHAKATLLGRLFEKNGLKLNRAQQFESLAYLEGYASWHVMAAELKRFGTPLAAFTADGVQTWQVAIVHLDLDGGELALDESHSAELPAAARAEVNQLLKRLDDLFDPESDLVAYVNGTLGMLVEQEFMSKEADGEDYNESCEDCVTRLQKHLLPRLKPLVDSVNGALLSIVTDEDMVWHGRPTCWVFLPLQNLTSYHLREARRILQDFAYPDGKIS